MANDEKMLPRMLLYHAMGYDLYGLPVEGFMIYIGDNEMNMTNTLEHKHLKYSFTLINLKDIDPDEFLASELPEEIILAVLAGHTKGDEKRDVIKKVMHKLHIIYKGDTKELGRRLEQMEVLGNLRNVQHIIIEEEKTMALTYDLTTDIRYNQGIESGIEKGIEKGMENAIRTIAEKLLLNQQLTMEQIAELIERPLAFVVAIKKQVGKS